MKNSLNILLFALILLLINGCATIEEPLCPMDVVAQQHNVANEQANMHRAMHDSVLNRNANRDEPIVIGILREVIGDKDEKPQRLPTGITTQRCPEQAD